MIAAIDSLLNGSEIDIQGDGDKDPLTTPIKEITDESYKKARNN